VRRVEELVANIREMEVDISSELIRMNYADRTEESYLSIVSQVTQRLLILLCLLLFFWAGEVAKLVSILHILLVLFLWLVTLHCEVNSERAQWHTWWFIPLLTNVVLTIMNCRWPLPSNWIRWKLSSCYNDCSLFFGISSFMSDWDKCQGCCWFLGLFGV